MKKLSVLIFATILFASCGGSKSRYQTITIKTGYGNIVAELYTDKAPKTAHAFIENIKAGIYKNSSFYRVVNDGQSASYAKGVVQGGVYATAPALANDRPFIDHESPSTTGITHIDGTLSMARTAPGTAKTEFFICIGDQTGYDNSKLLQPDGLGYAAFGRVIEGMNVVRKIQGRPSSNDKFDQNIKIDNISLN